MFQILANVKGYKCGEMKTIERSKLWAQQTQCKDFSCLCVAISHVLPMLYGMDLKNTGFLKIN